MLAKNPQNVKRISKSKKQNGGVRMISFIPILSRLAKFTAEDYKVLKKKYEDTAVMAKTTKKSTPKECAWETIHIMILSYSRRLNALSARAIFKHFKCFKYF